MSKKRIGLILNLTIFCGVSLLMPPFISAKIKEERYSTPIRVEIRLEKDSFRVGEQVKGVVIIKNNYPAAVPAIFFIRLFREGTLSTEIRTSVGRLPSGSIDFVLKNFGLPNFNDHVGAEGKWKIQIIQQNVDESYAAEAELIILPPLEKPDLSLNKNFDRYTFRRPMKGIKY